MLIEIKEALKELHSKLFACYYQTKKFMHSKSLEVEL
jgi:hypothetical protein